MSSETNQDAKDALRNLRALLHEKSVPAEDVEKIANGVACGNIAPLVALLMDEGFSLDQLESMWMQIVAEGRRKIN